MEAVSGFEPDEFRERGLLVLPWFDWGAFTGDIERHLGFLPSLGMVAESLETPGRVRLVASMPFAGNPRLRADDEVASVDEIEVTSVAELREMLEQKEGEVVEIGIRRDGKPQTVRVKVSPPDNVFTPTLEIGADVSRIAGRGNPLSHEVGHLLLAGWLEDQRDEEVVPAARQGNYGHPLLPDWLDEGVATVCESSSLRQSRWQLLMKEAHLPVPLGELIEMEHPLAGEDQRRGTRPIIRIEAGVEAEDGEGAHRGGFYAASLAVTEYLAQQGGERFLGRLALQLAAGRSMDEIVQDHSVLPNSIPDLDRSVHDWLALIGSWSTSADDSQSNGSRAAIAACILPGRLAISVENRLEVFPVVRFESPDALVLKTPAGEASLRVDPKGNSLMLAHPLLGEQVLQRRSEMPSELRLEPPSFPPPRPVTPEEVEDVVQRLASLVEEDQEVRHRMLRGLPTAAAGSAVKQVDRRSTDVLRDLVMVHGWIDGERFGRDAVENAWLLVHHTDDLSLKIAAWPHLQSAAENGFLDRIALKLFRDRLIQRLGGPLWAAEAPVDRSLLVTEEH